jgi:hypothetical protein
VLRTLGIIGVDQAITETDMKTYEGIFATPIPLPVLAAIATLVDRELPIDVTMSPITLVPASRPIEA